MKRLLFSIPVSLATVLLATSSFASTSAYDEVRSAPMFAIGGVGVAGIISKQETAMRELLESRSGADLLRKLLREATPAGQMYALYGLRELDVKDYDTLAQPFRAKGVLVERAQGCLISKSPTSEIVQWIDRYAKSTPAPPPK